ncbi:MAG: group III truncated hemoglobin [Parafilimonas sp.]
MRSDIKNRKDIEQLVNRFYDKVKQDEVIGFIFNDVAKVNWEKHLPVMYDFWENIIFLSNKYAGNPMVVHTHLNSRIQLTSEYFERWLKLFREAVDELFTGNKAMHAKEKAHSIANIMAIKIASDFNSGISFKQ